MTGPLWGQEKSEEIQFDDAPLVEHSITENDLQSYRDNPDFDYEVLEKKRTWWDDFKDWFLNLLLRFFQWLFGGAKAVGYLAVFLKLAPYILLGILIFILIKFFLNVNANRLQLAKKEDAFVSLSEEEHIIKNADIPELIRKALSDKNYRLAIRYYYLLILQLMSDKELINWELQKTNSDYLKELSTSNFQVPFETITRLYDYIWYGNFDLDELKYLKAEHDFVKLQKTLTNV